MHSVGHRRHRSAGTRLLAKLDARDRAELVVIAYDSRLVEPR